MNDTSMIFELIQQTARTGKGKKLNVSWLCDCAGVSRSGYYAWLKAAPLREAREEQDKKDFDLILEAYKFRGYDKGARSIHMRLLHMDPTVNMNLKKIRRLMKKYNLFCRIRKANPYRRIASALKTSNIADNLLSREFELYGPRVVLLTDITYIPYNGTFAYLSVIMDAFTKQILSYVLSSSLQVDFVLETVTKLLENHGEIDRNHRTIIHSDQGFHYTSYKFIDILNDSGLRQSMSRRGNCWGNAPQESFFGHMKDSTDFSGCETFDAVKVIIDDYINYYNKDRYVWDLCKLSPDEYYLFVTTGKYPIKGVKTPDVPKDFKAPEELGKLCSRTEPIAEGSGPARGAAP
ncbi:MAG: IS3 family transposase [Lachnospiraceae bacterium]|nr:IS3 family transposase [Candidatus Hippenecus merdae]